MLERNERLVLCIDPGFDRMGYAVEALAGNDLRLIVCDAIMTTTGRAYPLWLQLIYEELSVIIARYRPQEAAIEKLFSGKNTTTAIGVDQARGVALLKLVQSGLTVAEYTPIKVKLAVTDYGAGRKEQVGYMVQQILNLPSIPRSNDAATIAICHVHVFRLTMANTIKLIASCLAAARINTGHIQREIYQ